MIALLEASTRARVQERMSEEHSVLVEHVTVKRDRGGAITIPTTESSRGVAVVYFEETIPNLGNLFLSINSFSY